MLNCREATRLISQSMDTKLSWPRRLSIRVHLLYCVWCRRYARQLEFLRKATKHMPPTSTDPDSRSLSPEEKDQLRARLRDSLKNQPPSPSFLL